MKLSTRIVLGLIPSAFLILMLWAVFAYRTMVKKVNFETDFILRKYSENIIMRKLTGEQLPDSFNGVYNTYFIRKVSSVYADAVPMITYSDSKSYVSDFDEFSFVRTRKQIFHDSEGHAYELTVSLPVTERNLLSDHLKTWTAVLFLLLLVSLSVSCLLVVIGNLKPLKEIMKWLDNYKLGMSAPEVPSDDRVMEFKKLSEVLQSASERLEKQYQDRKIFIGNASHELQTPLAVCINRLELMIDDGSMTEVQTGELVKIRRTLNHLSRLNRTLLLMSKIENGQFPDIVNVNLGGLLSEAVVLFDEIYSSRKMTSRIVGGRMPVIDMNEQLADMMVNNLVKNAYAYGTPGTEILITMTENGFTISDEGSAALPSAGMFDPFYQPEGRREGSTGLGLALIAAVCASSSLVISYTFEEGRHFFNICKH